MKLNDTESEGPFLAINGPYCPWIHLADNYVRGSWRLEQRILPYYLLVMSYDGSEEVVIGKKRWAIAKNEGYLIQPGVLVDSIGSAKGSRPCWVHFDVSYSARRIEQRDIYPFDTKLEGRAHLLQPSSQAVWGIDLPLKIPKALQAMFARRLDPLVNLWRGQEPHDQFQANSELASLLAIWVRNQTLESNLSPESKPHLAPETRIRRAEDIAHTRLSHGFSVDEFAAAAGLQRAQFTRVYQKLRGKSPGQALRDMRLSEAERLLGNTNLSVFEIAKLVGYPSTTVFGRFFASRHGVSPSKWRQR